jgi:hypothetical protein
MPVASCQSSSAMPESSRHSGGDPLHADREGNALARFARPRPGRRRSTLHRRDSGPTETRPPARAGAGRQPSARGSRSGTLWPGSVPVGHSGPCCRCTARWKPDHFHDRGKKGVRSDPFLTTICDWRGRRDTNVTPDSIEVYGDTPGTQLTRPLGHLRRHLSQRGRLRAAADAAPRLERVPVW